MSQIEAIYRHGVFEPLQPVDLQEEQRVTLDIVETPPQMPTPTGPKAGSAKGKITIFDDFDAPLEN